MNGAASSAAPFSSRVMFSLYSSMIFSENWFPLFGITL